MLNVFRWMQRARCLHARTKAMEAAMDGFLGLVWGAIERAIEIRLMHISSDGRVARWTAALCFVLSDLIPSYPNLSLSITSNPR
jgi:hypothetical protein